MKVVILADGLDTYLADETVFRPKPMVEIGGRPILWHVVKGYAHFGITDFVICLGCKGDMVKEHFANPALRSSDVTINLPQNRVGLHQIPSEPWNITLMDTGEKTLTGGCLQRIRGCIDDEAFCMISGNGVADVDIDALLAFHSEENCLVTVTAVRPPGRFGCLELQGKRATGFQERVCPVLITTKSRPLPWFNESMTPIRHGFAPCAPKRRWRFSISRHRRLVMRDEIRGKPQGLSPIFPAR